MSNIKKHYDNLIKENKNKEATIFVGKNLEYKGTVETNKIRLNPIGLSYKYNHSVCFVPYENIGFIEFDDKLISLDDLMIRINVSKLIRNRFDEIDNHLEKYGVGLKFSEKSKEHLINIVTGVVITQKEIDKRMS